MLTCETDLQRIHQDFADASKTKAIPPSMLVAYDRRPPINRLVLDLKTIARFLPIRLTPPVNRSAKQASIFSLLIR